MPESLSSAQDDVSISIQLCSLSLEQLFSLDLYVIREETFVELPIVVKRSSGVTLGNPLPECRLITRDTLNDHRFRQVAEPQLPIGMKAGLELMAFPSADVPLDDRVGGQKAAIRIPSRVEANSGSSREQLTVQFRLGGKPAGFQSALVVQRVAATGYTLDNFDLLPGAPAKETS